MCFLEKGWTSTFLWHFNIIVSYIFPENFIEILQVVQKIWRFSSSLSTIFVNYLDFLTFSRYKNTNDVTFNRWCQHFFSLILPYVGCSTIVSSYIDIGLNIFKKPNLIMVKKTPVQVFSCEFQSNVFAEHLATTSTKPYFVSFKSTLLTKYYPGPCVFLIFFYIFRVNTVKSPRQLVVA